MKDREITTLIRKTRKSDETRARILDVALELFRQRGFEETTMRDIAAACGIALGATYYHFGSKEAIVLAYYELAKEQTAPSLEQSVTQARTLYSGLLSLIEVKLAYYRPNRKFLGALLPHAADPRDPLSPFSDDTRHIRRADQAYFDHLLDRLDVKVARDLRPYLPALLWLYQMLIILFWIYDRTPDQQRTHKVTVISLKLVVRLLDLSRYPMARPLRRLLLELLETAMGRSG
jgi:AcrR family transcriptional regulator